MVVLLRQREHANFFGRFRFLSSIILCFLAHFVLTAVVHYLEATVLIAEYYEMLRYNYFFPVR